MSARGGRSLTLKPTIVVSAGQVGQVSLENTGQSSQRDNWDFRVLRDNIDFLNGLGVNLVVDDHKQNIRNPGQCNHGLVCDNLVSKRTELSGAIEQSFQGLCRS